MERYSILRDDLARGNADNALLGRRLILPSSFQGGPRNMMQSYQDAMSIVRLNGKPDLFITMTCNPNWPEIQDNLAESDSIANRPDLVARVFNLKLKNLLDELTKDNIFGQVAAWMHVIEFQKRGLPHAHILLILSSDFKPRT